MEHDFDSELQAIAAGDATAFARWMSAVEPKLRSSLRPFARSVDVEAVVQEAFLRVWQVAPRFQPDGRPNGLLRLCFTSARNLAVSETRRVRATPELDAEFLGELELGQGGPALPDPLLRAAIVECRDKLPAKPRAALEQRLSSEGARADADLAAVLGMTLNTFLQNFTRARKLLAECLKKRGIALESELS